MRQIAFRAEPEIAERLDPVAEKMKSDPEFMGGDISRSALLRTLVMRGLVSAELQYGIPPEKPEEASRRTYRFWRRRLEEMQDEVESLERYIHRWEHGRVAEDEQVLREGELLDMGEARKRQLIDELQRYPDVEIRKKIIEE